MKTRHLILAALCATAVAAKAQVNMVGRQSTLDYSYVYGGGPFVWQGHPIELREDLKTDDVMIAHYADSQSGSWAGLSFSASVSIDILHTYVIEGPLTDARRILWNGTVDSSSGAGGDIGSAQIQGYNNLTLDFDLVNPVHYRLSGKVLDIDGQALNNYVSVQSFDGLVWQNTFLTWFVGNGFGPFATSGVLLPGSHRVNGALGNRSFMIAAKNSAGDFDLQFSQTVLPETATVKRGKAGGGGIADLKGEDGTAMRVCKFLVPNSQVAPVEVEIVGLKGGVEATEITFYLRSKMAAGGQFSQKIDLFDYSLNAYSTSATRTDPIGTTYNRRSITIDQDASHFLSPAGELKARYAVKQTGPSAVTLWCVDADAASWSVWE